MSNSKEAKPASAESVELNGYLDRIKRFACKKRKLLNAGIGALEVDEDVEKIPQFRSLLRHVLKDIPTSDDDASLDEMEKRIRKKIEYHSNVKVAVRKAHEFTREHVRDTLLKLIYFPNQDNEQSRNELRDLLLGLNVHGVRHKDLFGIAVEGLPADKHRLMLDFMILLWHCAAYFRGTEHDLLKGCVNRYDEAIRLRGNLIKSGKLGLKRKFISTTFTSKWRLIGSRKRRGVIYSDSDESTSEVESADEQDESSSSEVTVKWLRSKVALDECKTPEVNKESTIRIVRVKTPDMPSGVPSSIRQMLLDQQHRYNQVLAKRPRIPESLLYIFNDSFRMGEGPNVNEQQSDNETPSTSRGTSGASTSATKSTPGTSKGDFDFGNETDSDVEFVSEQYPGVSVVKDERDDDSSNESHVQESPYKNSSGFLDSGNWKRDRYNKFG